MSNKKILIIEDETSLAKALDEKFTHESFDVLLCNNGEDGLSLALKEKPDLILLDIMMPKMDGLTLLKNLRKDNTFGKNAKVIILTNSYDIDKVGEATKSGVFDYFIKSDTKISEILDKVKEKLDIK
ncbi:MAG: response regulator [Candidatus Magasanikbacteria bacterium]